MEENFTPNVGHGGAKITLRFLLPLMLIGSSLVSGGWAQRKATAKRASPTVLAMHSESTGMLSVKLSNAPDGARLTGGTTGQGSLDLGAASYGGGAFSPNVSVHKSQGRFVVSTRFGITVQENSTGVTTATVMAALAIPEPSFVLRLDGIVLGTTPQVVQGNTQLGVITQHRLEIEVPASVTERDSQLHNAIIFQVIAN